MVTSSEAVIQVHNEVPTHSGTGSGGGHRVALVASQNNPNKVSIIPCNSSGQTTLVCFHIFLCYCDQNYFRSCGSVVKVRHNS